MKHPHFAAVVLFCLTLSALSCRAALEKSGSGDASVRLVVSGLTQSGQSASSRAMFPFSKSISVSVQYPADVQAENGKYILQETFSASGGLTLTGLPAGEPLFFRVTALYGSTVLSSGTTTTTLNTGENSLDITLEGKIGNTGSLAYTNTSSVDKVLISSSLLADEGGYITLSIPKTYDANYFHVVCTDGSARFAWLAVYDETWKEVAPVCADRDNGWVVVRAGDGTDDGAGNRVFYVAVFNRGSFPGYPSGSSLSPTVEIRPATFVMAGATGSGTPSDPCPIASGTPLSGYSYFLAGGDYPLTASLSLTGDIRVYGGFTPGDWGTRTGTTVVKATTGSDTVVVGSTTAGYGCLDGVTVEAPPASSSSTASTAVNLSYASSYLLRNCVLKGSTSASVSGPSAALYVGSSSYSTSVEATGCTIEGPVIDSSTAVSIGYGIYIAQGTVNLHNSDVSGGSNGGNDSVYRIGIFMDGSSSALYAASSRIWGGYTNGSSNTECMGLDSLNSSTAVITNSVISGGYVSSDGGSAVAVYVNGGTVTLAGDVVDSGYSAGGDPSSLYVYSGTLSAYSCLLSSPDTGTSLTSGTLSTTDCYAVGAGLTTGLTAIKLDPGNYLYSYKGSATAFSDWLAGDWHLFSGVSLPASTGTCSAAALSSPSSSYPALLLDRAGNARSTSLAWSVGAYVR